MNSHEEQLILELASGSLSPEEARRLEASLSEKAQRELAAQRLVLGAIAAAEQPVMTDIERARMHRGVADGLTEITRELPASQVATPASPTLRRARTIRWMRFASAATVAALFIGVVAVGTQLTGDSDDDDAPRASADTTAAAADTVVENDSVEALSGAPVEPPVAPTTTAATRFRTATDLAEAPSVDASTKEADLEEVARFLAGLDVFDFDLALVEELACFAVADGASASQTLVKAFTLQYLNRAAVGFQTDAVDDEEAIRIYDLETCEELATAPR